MAAGGYPTLHSVLRAFRCHRAARGRRKVTPANQERISVASPEKRGEPVDWAKYGSAFVLADGRGHST